MMTRLAWAVLTCALALLLPSAALACPSCFSGTDANRMAFIWTAIIMTFLPLAIIGGTVYWVRRLARQRDLEEAAELGAGLES